MSDAARDDDLTTALDDLKTAIERQTVFARGYQASNGAQVRALSYAITREVSRKGRWRMVWWLAQRHADRALGPYLPHVDPWHERAVDRILLGVAVLRGGSRERRRR